jgi:hypothetical protein
MGPTILYPTVYMEVVNIINLSLTVACFFFNTNTLEEVPTIEKIILKRNREKEFTYSSDLTLYNWQCPALGKKYLVTKRSGR